MPAELGVPCPTWIRSLARGAVVGAGLDLAGQLGTLASWSGFARGRSTLLLALAAAALLAAGFANPWNRFFPRWRASLSLSILGILGFALLPRFPELLHLTGIRWLDATLVLLCPALPLMAHLARRSTSFGFAALGAASALLANEQFLLRRIGFGTSLLAWTLAWVVVEIRTWEQEEERPIPLNRAKRIGLLSWGTLLGFGVATLRPFLSQHLPPGRSGDVDIAVSMILMATVGWFAASSISKMLPLGWIAGAAALLCAFGAWVSWETLSVVTWRHWPAWLEPLRIAGSSHPKTLLAIWVFLAFPAMSSGMVSKGLFSGGAASWILAWIGIWAGTSAGECFALPALDEGGVWESSARARLLHPSLVRVRSYALNPDGASTRFATQSEGESIETTAWQSMPWSRGKGWARLEACELLPARAVGLSSEERTSVGLLCIGFLQSAHANAIPEGEKSSMLILDPLPTPGVREARGRNPCEFLVWTSLPLHQAVLLSHPAPQSQGLSLAQTRTALERLAQALGPDGSLWIWCDPRGLEPEGVKTTLATWRAACPHGSVHVLLDGYAGPLIGLCALGPEPRLPEMTALEITRLHVSELRVSDASIATADRPLLHWESASHRAPLDLPSSAVLRTLGRILGLPPGDSAARILEGLARHSDAQEMRETAASAYDRIRVPANEIGIYLEALRSEPHFEPLIRHLDFVAEILYRKRDFDVLLELMRVATSVRPDAASFHRHLGRALLELLDIEGGVLELEQAYCLAPGEVEVRTELSKAYGKVGRFQDGARLLESVWEEKPEVEIAKGLGLTYLKLAEFSRARRFLEFVHARTPGDVDVERALQTMNREGH